MWSSIPMASRPRSSACGGGCAPSTTSIIICDIVVSMNILYAAAEVAPLIKTGGLADVAGALPAALRRIGHDIRIVMPRYRRIRDNGVPQAGPLAATFLPSGERQEE